MSIKKIMILNFSLLMLFTTIIPVNAIDTTTTIIVKKELMLSQKPYMLDEQVMLPLRSFEESQDYDVIWNGKKQDVSVLKNGKELYKVVLNSDVAIVEGKEYKLKLCS